MRAVDALDDSLELVDPLVDGPSVTVTAKGEGRRAKGEGRRAKGEGRVTIDGYGYRCLRVLGNVGKRPY